MRTWDTIRASKKDGEPDRFILTRDGEAIGTPFATYEEGMRVGYTVLVKEAECCRKYGDADFLAVERAVERATEHAQPVAA